MASEPAEHLDADPRIGEIFDSAGANHDPTPMETIRITADIADKFITSLPGAVQVERLLIVRIQRRRRDTLCRSDALHGRKITSHTAGEICFDAANHLRSVDHIHAAWQSLDQIDTPIL